MIAGGKLVEYAAHVVPEAGANMQPELVGDGVPDCRECCRRVYEHSALPSGVWISPYPQAKRRRAVLSAMKRDDFSERSSRWGIPSASGRRSDARYTFMYRNCQLS